MNLEERLQRLEDLEAIRLLVHRYAELCDDGYKAAPLAELFTEDAYWTASSPDGAISYGEYHSKAEIRDFFAGVSEVLGPMTLHYVMAPAIELRGDGTAHGTWYTLVPATMKTRESPAGEAVLIGSTYYHEYAKVAGAWKFSRIETTIHFRSPVKSGWVESPFVE
jgi:SnoaL-like protein